MRKIKFHKKRKNLFFILEKIIQAVKKSYSTNCNWFDELDEVN